MGVLLIEHPSHVALSAPLPTFFQVSFGSSSNNLSDRRTFPSFFRTIPSDRHQADAIVQLLAKFKWNWVAALATDNLYGRQALEVFVQEALLKDVCVAYEAILPNSPNLTEQSAELVQIAERLENSSINATVVFASPEEAEELLRVAVATRITRRVWIASECWSTTPSLVLIPNLSHIGTLFGVAVKSGAMPGFVDYIQNLLDQPRTGQAKEDQVHQQCPECSSLTSANLSATLQQSRFYSMFNAYKAVYAVGHALHQLLRCNATDQTCDADREVSPWQVSERGRSKPGSPALAIYLRCVLSWWPLGGKDIILTPHGLWWKGLPTLGHQMFMD